ncbi:conserved domain protein, partial [Turicibacter sanguinis PC909]
VWWQCSNGHEWETKVSHRTRGSGCVYCAGQKVWEGFNDLATTYPGLVTEWHPTKNGDSTPQDVSAGSNKKVWWQCSKGHEWKAALAHRKNGTQCPVCNSNGTSHPEQCLLFYLSKVFPNAQNRYRLGSDEIDLLIPEIGLVIEYDGVYWHRLKLQKDIEKSQRLKSFYKILRIREEGLPLFKLEGVDCMVTTGHEKDLSTTIDKVFDFILKNFNLEPLVVETISNVVVDLEKDWINILENYRSYEYKNSLAVLHPELVKQWHPIKNGQLKPENFRSHSMEKVWWQCSKGHEWRAIIDSRSKSRGCPYCANKLVWAGFNDLATIHPELEKEWHPTKNADLTPQQVTIGSGKKIWWQCSKGHEWQVPVSHRTSKNTGCPYCSGYYPILGENDLGTTHPELIKEWHPTKNEHLAPQDVSAGSNKKVWWQCSKNHEWEATIANRTSNQTGCPYCSGKSVLNGFNDLATFEPILAKEWHLTKNGDLSPQDVSTGSNKKVWWQCSKNHEWEAVINSRSEGRGCPYCAGRYAIVGETDLTTTHPDLAKQWHPTKNGHLTP